MVKRGLGDDWLSSRERERELGEGLGRNEKAEQKPLYKLCSTLPLFKIYPLKVRTKPTFCAQAIVKAQSVVCKLLP